MAYILFMHDPFFGDAISSTYQSANHIYDNSLMTIFYPIDTDPGHPTLYPYLLAVSWKIFGQTIEVSHAYSAFWMLLLSLLFVKIARLFLTPQNTFLAAILLVSFGTYLSLSAMVLNTTMLMFFVLISFYGLYTKKSWLLLIGNCLMVLTHLQGTFFVIGFGIAHVICDSYFNKKNIFYFIKRHLIYYLIPSLLFIGWIYLHYLHTGWYTHSPNYSDTQSPKTLFTVVKSILIIIWRLIDYGMLPIHVFALLAIFKRQSDRILALTYISLLLSNMIIMSVFLENTIGHRYFFVIHLFGIIICFQYLAAVFGEFKYKLYVMIFCVLVAGNFLYYPGKTLGDATLAYRSYFEIEKKIKQDFADTTRFYSYAPIANISQAKSLDDSSLDIGRISSNNISEIPVILQSNLNAEFDPETKSLLASTWYGKSYEKGAVFVNVYLNPALYSKPLQWKLRTPGVIENYMESLKKNWKRK